MKKLLVILILPIFVLAQSENTSSLIELKSQITSQIHNDESMDTQENILDQAAMHKKSPGLAILYSLMLPGMGELYAGGYNSGIYFTIADAVAWSTLAGMKIYGNWKEDNYRSFAVSQGGATLDGKDDDYFANIGIYSDIYQYNNDQMLNRNYDEIYDVETHYWKWDSQAERKEYRNMWTSSENAYNNVRFAVGALIVNRIVSAINAVRLVSAYNKRIDEQSWNVSVGMTNPESQPTTLNLNFTTRF